MQLYISSKAPVTVKGGQAGRAPAQKKKTKNKNPKRVNVARHRPCLR